LARRGECGIDKSSVTTRSVSTSMMIPPSCRRSRQPSTTSERFTSAHASIHNHFNHDRHLNRRDIFKQNRAAALAEWRQLAA
jgi:putative transposase